MNNGKREMTIEEMIASGCPWEQIQARIERLQQEQKMRQDAEKQAQVRDARSTAARERFIEAFLDWATIEGIIEDAPEDRERMGQSIGSACDEFVADIRRMKALGDVLASMGIQLD